MCVEVGCKLTGVSGAGVGGTTAPEPWVSVIKRDFAKICVSAPVRLVRLDAVTHIFFLLMNGLCKVSDYKVLLQDDYIVLHRKYTIT